MLRPALIVVVVGMVLLSLHTVESVGVSSGSGITMLNCTLTNQFATKPFPALTACPAFKDLSCCSQEVAQDKVEAFLDAYAQRQFGDCEACLTNFRSLYCRVWCDPDQQRFLTVVQRSRNGGQAKQMVLRLCNSFCETLYASCREAQVVQDAVKDMTPQEWCKQQVDSLQGLTIMFDDKDCLKMPTARPCCHGDCEPNALMTRVRSASGGPSTENVPTGESTSEDGLETWFVVGIVIGSVLVATATVMGVYYWRRRVTMRVAPPL